MILLAHETASSTLPAYLQTSPANIAYIVASALFVFGLKMLGSAKTARKGNMLSALGMLIAIGATCTEVGLDFTTIAIGAGVGSLIGAIAARTVKLTGIPEMVALFNGFGGMASLLVGWAEVLRWTSTHHLPDEMAPFTAVASGLALLIGGVTFTGSIVAYLKLSGKVWWTPSFAGQAFLNLLLLLAGLGATGYLGFLATDPATFFDNAMVIIYAIIAISFVLGVAATIGIGGADMPVVISLLNSYSGLAACAAGFIIFNNVLIVAGALVGASGLILTGIMCKAMNRSLTNVLVGGVGGGKKQAAAGDQGEAQPISAEDTYYILEAATSCVIVPGYGMAVAQAQHAVRELSDILQANGCEVNFAIHPVAGRMPGHMNVLLAEADVPYEQLVEPDDVNPTMDAVDVTIVIGANDVVNPMAREEGNDVSGMPIIDVDMARTCIVLKRSLKPGFAGVQNPLFFKENTRMLLGDAKASVQKLVGEFKDAAS